MSTTTGLPGTYSRLLWDMVRHRPIPAVSLIVFTLVGNGRAGVYVAATGGLVQALIERDQRQAVTWAVVYLGASLVEQTFWPTRNLLVDTVTDDAVHRIQRRVLEHSGSVPLIAFETEGFYTRLQRANDNLGGQLMGMFMRLQETLGLAVFAVSILVPLWLVNHWIVPILLIGLVPGLIVEFRTGDLFHVVRTRHAGGDQFLDRIGSILTDRNVAAEIRLFGNGRSLVNRWRATRGNRATDMLGAEHIRMKAGLTGDLGVLAAIIASQALVVALMIEGRVQPGAWATVTMGTAWLSGMAWPIAEMTRGIVENRLFVNDLFLFEEEFQQRWSDKTVSAGQANPPPARGGMAIEARDVTFRYPDAPGNPVIRGISLRLEPGERVALVGVNGAGKSTLVRLLTGLYAPDSGTVEMDGHPTIDPAAYPLQRQVGAVFQDYVAWQMTARDNIGIGNLDRRDDDAALSRAAEAAGIGDLVAGLPDGLDTWLGREFGERDLSGGQWQRIAIARAFVRDTRFLVLDEPTAALDPLAEQRIFERFAELAAGKTALMISHRLGPARFADRVLVMADGKIIESGHHDELMASGGTYAQMFNAQSEWYNDTTNDADA